MNRADDRRTDTGREQHGLAVDHRGTPRPPTVSQGPGGRSVGEQRQPDDDAPSDHNGCVVPRERPGVCAVEQAGKGFRDRNPFQAARGARARHDRTRCRRRASVGGKRGPTTTQSGSRIESTSEANHTHRR